MSADKEGYILVSCGGVQGKLIMNKFICPGIHQLCIEVDGKLMTPKAFCVLGEKERLKDWKNAIRINGKSIRRSMYARDIDFYKHNEICTGRCMSRNYGPSKYEMKIENLRQANTDSNGEWTAFEPVHSVLDGPAYNILREVGNGTLPANYKDRPLSRQVVFPGQDHLDAFSTTLVQPGDIKQEVLSEDDADEHTKQKLLPVTFGQDSPVSGIGSTEFNCSSDIHKTRVSHSSSSRHRRKLAMPQRVITDDMPTPVSHVKRNGAVDTEQESKIMQLVAEFPDTDSLFEDGVAFWQGVKDIGILDSVVRDIKQAVDNIKNDMSRFGIQELDADKLSIVVKELGLVTKLKWRLAEHKARTESEKDRLLQEIETLKMKVAQSEQKQQELKRKSECFNSLLDARPAKQVRNSPEVLTTEIFGDKEDAAAADHASKNSPVSSVTDDDKSEESCHSC